VTKVILRFSKVFWPENEPYIQTIHRDLRFLNAHFFGKEVRMPL
jgi:hypothetical protein